MLFNPDLDAGQPALDASQRRQVEKLVRRAGKACEVCASVDLSCDDRAVRTKSDGISVRLFCNNRKFTPRAWSEQSNPYLLRRRAMRTGSASFSSGAMGQNELRIETV